jgi:DNA polymerase-4
VIQLYVTSSEPIRKILHVDMDAFYASVEQRDDAALRGRPVAVGGGGPRGVVAAASYEARAFGVRSAMPSSRARRLCADLVFVRPRFDVYKEVSDETRAIFRSFTDLVEPLSLDEAYLDVTHPRKGSSSATLIARAIKEEIRELTGLTASAGVSFNKFLAKVASGMDKPDGLTVVRPEGALDFIARLPVERFHGIGAATARKMHAAGISTGADLQAMDEVSLARLFGKAGRHFYRISRALDDRAVRTDRIRKSIGAERTFRNDLDDAREMGRRLSEIAAAVAERMERIGAAGRTVTVKIRHRDFTTYTRTRTLPSSVSSADDLTEVARSLLMTPAPPVVPVRLLGLTVSSLDRAHEDRQFRLDFEGV